MSNKLLVEKYSPKSLSDLTYNDKVTSLIEKLSKGIQRFLNLEFSISFNIICSSLFLPVARKNLHFLIFDIFSITLKNILAGILLVGPEPPIPKSIFISFLLI